MAHATPTQVSTGLNNSCAIDAGALTCWGDNSNGQIGDGTTTIRLVPTAVSGMSSGVTYVAVAGDGEDVCAVQSGSLYCWGLNDHGQLGDGTTTNRSTPTLVTLPGTGSVTQVSTSGQHTCAVRGGAGYCWGRNDYGQLGNNTTTELHAATAGTPTLSTTGVLAFSLNANYSCELGKLGNLAVQDNIGCFGHNTAGNLGDNTTSDYHIANANVIIGGALINPIAITAGIDHACAIVLLNGGSTPTAQCWGNNANGEVGDGTTTNRLIPTDSIGGTTLNQISAGDHYTCGGDGSNAYCWGLASSYDFVTTTVYSGNNTTKHAFASGFGDALSISAGETTTCFIDASTSSVVCSGTNAAGQVGNGTTSDWGPPIDDPTTHHTVAAGYAHSCAISATTHKLYCWGDNAYGEIGDGTTTNRTTPVQITPGSGTPVDISAGMGMDNTTFSEVPTTCAIMANGSTNTLYCWGINTYGQLGDGTTTNRSTPTAVTLPGKPLRVSTGGRHTCALVQSSNLQLYCWGDNSYGQLGLGSTGGTYATPQHVTSVGTGIGVVDVALGWNFTCAITRPLYDINNNDAYCWGRDEYQQLGSGAVANSDTNSPGSPITLSYAPTSIATGWAHACVVATNSSAYCWGNNANGQLGDNSITQRASPVLVSGLISWATLSGGGDHTCGVDSSGYQYCWGWAGRGQISSPTTSCGLGCVRPTDEHTPYQYFMAHFVTQAIAAGGYHTVRFDSGPVAGTYTVFGTGDNPSGQVGDGTTTRRLAFVTTTAPSGGW